MSKNDGKVGKIIAHVSPAKKRKLAVDAILAGTMTRREVAEQLGVDKSTVRDWLKKSGALMDWPAKARPDAATRRRLAVRRAGRVHDRRGGNGLVRAWSIHVRSQFGSRHWMARLRSRKNRC